MCLTSNNGWEGNRDVTLCRLEDLGPCIGNKAGAAGKSTGSMAGFRSFCLWDLPTKKYLLGSFHTLGPYRRAYSKYVAHIRYPRRTRRSRAQEGGRLTSSHTPEVVRSGVIAVAFRLALIPGEACAVVSALAAVCLNLELRSTAYCQTFSLISLP